MTCSLKLGGFKQEKCMCPQSWVSEGQNQGVCGQGSRPCEGCSGTASRPGWLTVTGSQDFVCSGVGSLHDVLSNLLWVVLLNSSGVSVREQVRQFL